MLPLTVCLLIIALAWWNAWRAGRYWTEVRITGGWARIFVTVSVLASGVGFTAAYVGIGLLALNLRPLADGWLVWCGWETLLALLVTTIGIYPIEGMLLVWRERELGDKSLANYGQQPYMIAAWQQTAQRPGVLRSVTRGVENVLVRFPRRRRTDGGSFWSGGGRRSRPAAGSSQPSAALRSGGAGGSRGFGGSGGPLPDAAALAALSKGSSGSSFSGKLGGGAKLKSGGGSGGGLSGLDLDLDGEGAVAILVIALVIIALLSGVMTTVWIVRTADRKVALDVLAEAWFDWED